MATYITNPHVVDNPTFTGATQVPKEVRNQVTRLLGAIAHRLSRVAFRRDNHSLFRITESIAAFRSSSNISFHEDIRLKAYLSGIGGNQI